MLSRAADAIYWMERYRERAEDTARLVDASLNLSLDALPGCENPWASVIQAVGGEAMYAALHGTEPAEAGARRFLTFDESNPDSIISCLARARSNARSVRELIPADMWRELNTAHLYVQHAARQPESGALGHAFYARVKRHCQLASAMAEAGMSRDEAWHILRLGGLLERADKTSRLLDVKYFLILPSVEEVGGPYDSAQWSALLESAGAEEMFRKRHQTVRHVNVVGFLVLDRDFPRSILYCLSEAERSLAALVGAPGGRPGTPAERALGSVRAELAYRTAEEILRRGLHEFLNDVQVRLDAVHGAVATAFFEPRAAADGPLTHDQ